MTTHKKIILLEPYYGGSHRVWADTYKHYSQHTVHLLTLPAQNWKWRMQGGAITLAQMLKDYPVKPDVLLVSDMLDVALLRALTIDSHADVPIVLYLHENQLTYPQNQRQQHGMQYGFINYSGALVSDRVFFNSVYHRDDFLKAVWRMLRHHAWDDYDETSLTRIRDKAQVLPPVMDLARFDAYRPTVPEKSDNPPVILWNHRREADKNPDAFFQALYQLQTEGFEFEVILLGENFGKLTSVFERAKQRLAGKIRHDGYVDSFMDYARLLWQSDYIISTAWHDFFGMSVVEAMYCGCTPILAHRLNYPYLLPESEHDACLFKDDKLIPLLKLHLQGQMPVDKGAICHHLKQFDRDTLIQTYDDALAAMCH